MARRPVTPALPEGTRHAHLCQNRYAATGAETGHGHGHAGALCESAARRGGPLVRSPLDEHGRHALVCKVGGVAVRRHNVVRDYLGYALRPLVAGVAWERLVPEYATPANGDARLDLVVTDVAHGAALDVCVFYPLQPSGRATYGHSTHEQRKHRTYPQTAAGRRTGAPPMIPIVVSTFGVVSSTAASWLQGVEESACLKGRPFFPEPAGPQSLCQLVSLVTILESAQIVLSAHSQGGFDLGVVSTEGA